MTPEFLKWLMSLGVGGILAAGMFVVYRKDMIAAQARTKELGDHVVTLAQQLITTIGEVRAALAETTALMTRLLQRMDAQEGKPNGRLQ